MPPWGQCPRAFALRKKPRPTPGLLAMRLAILEQLEVQAGLDQVLLVVDVDRHPREVLAFGAEVHVVVLDHPRPARVEAVFGAEAAEPAEARVACAGGEAEDVGVVF